MIGMKRYKLSEVANVEISGVDKKCVAGETSVRLCNFVDVYRNWAITSEMSKGFMEATARQAEIDRFTIKKGQVALTKDSETRDDIGISTYIADNFDDVLLGYHNALITPNPKILNGKYLNALLHTDYAKRYFAYNASGSGQRYALSTDALNSFPVLLPSLEEQEKIGNIFSSIDRKILLNRALNQNLEALAKQLYDYWFVQFDFPDENGRPYKSSGGKMVWNEKLKREIPECWDLILVKDTCPIVTGKEDANFSSINGQYPFFTCSKDTLKCNTPAFKGSAILIAGNGDFNVKHHTGKFNAYQRTYVLQPSANYYACLYLAASEKIERFKTNSNGSIIKFITKGDIEDIELFKSEDINLYNSLNHLIFEIEQKKQEIESLTKQRDELLPLLMNGQVSVNSDLSNG